MVWEWGERWSGLDASSNHVTSQVQLLCQEKKSTGLEIRFLPLSQSSTKLLCMPDHWLLLFKEQYLVSHLTDWSGFLGKQMHREPEIHVFHKRPVCEENVEFSVALLLQTTYMRSGKAGNNTHLNTINACSHVPVLPETPDHSSRPWAKRQASEAGLRFRASLITIHSGSFPLNVSDRCSLLWGLSNLGTCGGHVPRNLQDTANWSLFPCVKTRPKETFPSF